MAGEGHGAAEDVGGPRGWKELKEAYAAKKPTAEQKGKREWYEDDCANGYKSGLKCSRHWLWDKAEVIRNLAALPKMSASHNFSRVSYFGIPDDRDLSWQIVSTLTT
ncbi:MAG: hypothetical protein Q9187_006237 [Circinaria calcarea]